MNRRAVFFTDTAQKHVERERAWWLANRDHTAIFADEVERAVDLVRILPGAGTPYERAGIEGLRRVYLERIGSRRGPRMSR